jgi:sugar/nucleoside kinase (ribokinase family)
LNLLPQYLVIGHVTKDLVPDGSFRYGGTATYSALAADRLGLRVGVLTSAETDLALFPETPSVAVHRRPAGSTTTFENIYEGRSRRQYVRAVADVLTPGDLPDGWGEVPIVHLGPVAQEIDVALAARFPRSFLGVTPQGWLRRWNGQGLVEPEEWLLAAEILEQVDVVVLSPEDLGGDLEAVGRLADMARLLVLTVGDGGAVIYRSGSTVRVPAYEAAEVDPTGAGDVFATAFLIRMAETGDPLDAARFANCVSSFVIEGIGPSNMPSRDQVEWRMQHGRLRG